MASLKPLTTVQCFANTGVQNEHGDSATPVADLLNQQSGKQSHSQ